MSFSTGFKSALSKAETEAKAIVKEVETEIIYSAESAVSNLKAEAAKLDTYVESKLASIAAHNKNILNLQNLVKEIEADVAKAKAVKDKIVSAVS